MDITFNFFPSNKGFFALTHPVETNIPIQDVTVSVKPMLLKN
ncbi:hypothetical protein PAJ34TS1_06900 [Paenibacillus azoreducens]|uniref:Uncharacterized protein n=1 Tax=Paenibacillus azoreducens TaxID=116718 RepID=A0A919YIN6_9BACL|nr:hypothetical protein J34TS1_48380 [Paenibacillus azoreducens]